MKFDNTFKLAAIRFFTYLVFLTPVITFFFMQRGLNLFEIVILESVFVLFMVFGEVPTGIVADRYGRKTSIIIYCIITLAAEVIFLFGYGFWTFAISYAILGIGWTFISGAGEALLYDSLKEEKKTHLMKKAMGTILFAGTSSTLVAGIIGSFLAANLTMESFVLLIQMTLIAIAIGALFSLLLKEPKYKKKIVEPNPIKLLIQGITLIRKNPSLIKIILLGMFSSPFFYVIMLLYQPYFKSAGVEVAWFGTIIAVALGLSAFASKYAHWIEEKVGMRWSIFLITLLPGIFYVIMGLTNNMYLAVGSVVAIIALDGLRVPMFSDYQNAHIESYNRATVLSIISLSFAFYHVFARFIIGWVSDINISWAFLGIGVVIVISSLLFRIDERHIKVVN